MPRLAERYRLGFATVPSRGHAGDRAGRGTGASLEFQDRRAYVPGDDVRHVDWRGFARTDQLLVRLFRDEVVPHVDVLLDASRSMSVDSAKASLATDLAALIALVARADGWHARIVLLGDRAEPTDLARFEAEGVEFAGASPLAAGLAEAAALLRRGSVRVLVSDFLSPHDAAALVRPLAAEAGGIALLQTLSADDASPPAGAALRLTDSETGAMLDVVLDPRTVALYRERLRRLSGALETECRRAGGRFLSVVACGTLDAACREVLAPAGVLSPR